MNFRLTEHDKALLTGPLSPKGRNWPLLIKAALQIMNEPRLWKQNSWAGKIDCGTAYCFAGHAITLAGHEFVFFGMSKSVLVKAVGALAASAFAGESALGPLVPAQHAGRELLRLSAGDAEDLFEGGRTYPGILALLNRWAAADHVELPEDLQLAPELVESILSGRISYSELHHLENRLLNYDTLAVPAPAGR